MLIFGYLKSKCPSCFDGALRQSVRQRLQGDDSRYRSRRVKEDSKNDSSFYVVRFSNFRVFGLRSVDDYGRLNPWIVIFIKRRGPRPGNTPITIVAAADVEREFLLGVFAGLQHNVRNL